MMEAENMMIVLFTIAAVLVTFLFGLIMTASHWWKKCRDVIVSSNGQFVSDIKIYRSRDGNLLVHMEKSEDMYVVRPENQEIGMPNVSSFFILPGYAFSRNVRPLLVPMGKAEIDPQLDIKQESIEFNSSYNGRVRVNWQSGNRR
jgi:zinc transporter ZupT